MNTTQPVQLLQEILSANKTAKHKKGVYSVCCTNESVLLSSLEFCLNKPYPIIIESTSNQVDQFGGYTGMTPSEFVSYVHTLAEKVGYPKEKIILGGDHLGPNTWQSEDADLAMKNAKALIADYIKAGYRKIHLDASMACKNDILNNQTLPDEIVAERAAILCSVAEHTWQSLEKKGEPPVYIIGTEVPVPGGSKENEDSIQVTSNNDAKKTFSTTQYIFEKHHLHEAWTRVVAMVVQPGVEFSDENIFYYDKKSSQGLSSLCKSFGFVYEAHSTDYQTQECLVDLVKNHYAILKVGPWLTYAYREALVNLAHIENHLINFGFLSKKTSNFFQRVESHLQSHPQYWQKYYHGTSNEIAYKLIFSLSDRIRYYWPQKEMSHIATNLLDNLSNIQIPYSLANQYFPDVVEKISKNQWSPQLFINEHIKKVLEKYEYAIL